MLLVLRTVTNDSRLGVGLYAQSRYYGVHGESSGGRGVYGSSETGYGVYGNGVYGVVGIATGGYGVQGISPDNTAVHGYSSNHIGVEGISISGTGVRGKSTSGYAGDFEGNVRVQGTVEVADSMSASVYYDQDDVSYYMDPASSATSAILAGKVGIGIPTPDAKLDVNGQIKIRGGSPGAGKVLTSDAAGLASWQTPAGGGGPDGDWAISGDDMYAMPSGNVGVGISSPVAKLDVRGTLNVGVDGAGHDVTLFGRESGSRMFWDESKMALRAGRATGSQWADTNVGLYSIAMGYDATASGNGSAAIGAAYAGGNYSIAVGANTTTSRYSYASTAMGNNTTASGDYSTAMGGATTASGSASTSMGSGTTASGSSSTAMGTSTTASGDYSTAMGSNTTASGLASAAIGQYVTAGPAGNTIAIGKGLSGGSRLVNNIANSLMVGFGSSTPTLFVDGSGVGIGTTDPGALLDVTSAGRPAATIGAGATTATGIHAVALGANADATGDYSIAMGTGTTASGAYSTAIGTDITVSGSRSVGIRVGSGTAPDISANNVMAIMGGNVGIGTTIPGAKLEVSGQVKITGGAPGAGKVLTSDTSGLATWQEPSVTVPLDLSGSLPNPGAIIKGYNSSYGVGVWGESDSGRGISGYSTTGTAIWGYTYTGWAGYFQGPENDGTNATVAIISGGDRMLLDNNEIDSVEKALYLNNNSSRNVMIATGGGNVGIGTTTPSEKLEVNGTARLRGIAAGTGTKVVADGNGKLWKETSSKRYKRNIENLEISLDEILKLRPVRFQWRTTGQEDVGLIAEEVDEVLGDLVIYDKDGRPDAVKYDKLALYLLGVVKAQQEKIADLEKIGTQNRELRQRLEALERKMEQDQFVVARQVQ